MTEPHVLEQRARSLRVLADDVQDMTAAALNRADQPVWQCEHAEQVRDALHTQRGQARAAADRLRETARRLDLQAGQIREQRRLEAQRRAAEAETARAAAEQARRDARATP